MSPETWKGDPIQDVRGSPANLQPYRVAVPVDKHRLMIAPCKPSTSLNTEGRGKPADRSALADPVVYFAIFTARSPWRWQSIISARAASISFDGNSLASGLCRCKPSLTRTCAENGRWPTNHDDSVVSGFRV